MKNLLLLFSILLLNQFCMAQSLSQYEWENRIILLFAPDFKNQNLEQQLDFFQKNKKGLTDRKLIIYQVTPEGIKKDGKLLKKKGALKNELEKFEMDNRKFTFVLIGLDGREKMRSSQVISIQKLFNEIDQMPMRQNEIKRNKN